MSPTLYYYYSSFTISLFPTVPLSKVWLKLVMQTFVLHFIIEMFRIHGETPRYFIVSYLQSLGVKVCPQSRKTLFE